MDELISAVKKAKRFYKMLAEAEGVIDRIKDLERREATLKESIVYADHLEAQSQNKLRVAQVKMGEAQAQMAKVKLSVEAERAKAAEAIKVITAERDREVNAAHNVVTEAKARVDAATRIHQEQATKREQDIQARIVALQHKVREQEAKLAEATRAYEQFKAQL